jgi:hypothetical protein
MEPSKSAGTSDGFVEPCWDCGRRVRQGGATRAGGATADPAPVTCGMNGA